MDREHCLDSICCLERSVSMIQHIEYCQNIPVPTPVFQNPGKGLDFYFSCSL